VKKRLVNQDSLTARVALEKWASNSGLLEL
jgi:hypothetical protein